MLEQHHRVFAGKNGKKWKCNFLHLPPPRRTPHPARKRPNRSIPVVLLMGRFQAPLRVETPTDIASHKAGEDGVLAVRQDGSGKGRSARADRRPNGLQDRRAGKVQEGAQRPPDGRICAANT